MEITHEIRDGADIFGIIGRLDIRSSQEVQGAVVGKIKENSRIIIDMSKCDYVSSSGLRAILIIAKQSVSLSAKTILVGVLPEVYDIMEMTGFNQLLEFAGKIEDALNIFRAG